MAVPFQIYAKLLSARHEETGISLFFVEIKFILCQQFCKHYEIPLGYTKWCLVNYLSRIFPQRKCQFFYFYYMFCVLDMYLLLCYVVATYIHHHWRTRDRYLRQKDKRKAERCFRVALWISDNVKRDKFISCEFKIFS